MGSAGSPSSISAKDLDSLLTNAITAQYPDADQHALRAAANLKRATNILNQLEFLRLHPTTGNTPVAFRALFMIWCFEPIEAKDIARLSGVSPQAVSGVVLILERKGLISRTASRTDRRHAPIRTTPEGAALVVNNLRPQNEVQHRYFGALSPDEVHTLTELLTRLIIAAHDSGQDDSAIGADLDGRVDGRLSSGPDARAADGRRRRAAPPRTRPA